MTEAETEFKAIVGPCELGKALIVGAWIRGPIGITSVATVALLYAT